VLQANFSKIRVNKITLQTGELSVSKHWHQILQFLSTIQNTFNIFICFSVEGGCWRKHVVPKYSSGISKNLFSLLIFLSVNLEWREKLSTSTKYTNPGNSKASIKLKLNPPPCLRQREQYRQDVEAEEKVQHIRGRETV
jgi:hypothetical protein